MNIKIEEVESVLRNKNIPANVIIQVVNELEAVAEENKAEKSAEPKQKNEYGVILLDPNNVVRDNNLTALVVQYPHGENPNTILDRLYAATYAQNAAGKRKKYNIQTVGEAARSVKRKFYKENRLMIKTKEPVLVVKSDNNIPRI